MEKVKFILLQCGGLHWDDDGLCAWFAHISSGTIGDMMQKLLGQLSGSKKKENLQTQSSVVQGVLPISTQLLQWPEKLNKETRASPICYYCRHQGWISQCWGRVASRCACTLRGVPSLFSGAGPVDTSNSSGRLGRICANVGRGEGGGDSSLEWPQPGPAQMPQRVLKRNWNASSCRSTWWWITQSFRRLPAHGSQGGPQEADPINQQPDSEHQRGGIQRCAEPWSQGDEGHIHQTQTSQELPFPLRHSPDSVKAFQAQIPEGCRSPIPPHRACPNSCPPSLPFSLLPCPTVLTSSWSCPWAQ